MEGGAAQLAYNIDGINDIKITSENSHFNHKTFAHLPSNQKETFVSLLPPAVLCSCSSSVCSLNKWPRVSLFQTLEHKWNCLCSLEGFMCQTFFPDGKREIVFMIHFIGSLSWSKILNYKLKGNIRELNDINFLSPFFLCRPLFARKTMSEFYEVGEANWKRFNIPLNYANANTIHFTLQALNSNDDKQSKEIFLQWEIISTRRGIALKILNLDIPESFILKHFWKNPLQTRE